MTIRGVLGWTPKIPEFVSNVGALTLAQVFLESMETSSVPKMIGTDKHQSMLFATMTNVAFVKQASKLPARELSLMHV